MAKKRKKMKKSTKKKIFRLVLTLLILAIVGVSTLFWEDLSPLLGLDTSSSSEDNSSHESIVTDDLSIHFLEVGNKYTGDCTLIKVGNTEVLIDAGSRKGSAKTIVPYVQQYCTDGVLEYVIATHAHQDHIAGFVGTSDSDGIFESFDCKVIIDYPLTNATSQIKEDYENLRDEEVAAGAKHYTALECWNNANGASRSYELADGITMSILYQAFYEEETGDENDYSVCMLLSQGSNHYLFTGDLEKEGEESLVVSNNLPECVLFKGGHHGSPTSNTTELLEKIKPEIVAVCCCCGSDEYTDNIDNMFPSQAFVDRVAPYTDKIYVTSVVADNEDGYVSMNGNIVVTSDGGEVTVNCSNNNTLFKDTDWFKKNRKMPDAWSK
ncbi:MAG: MBL fold metallo-hydrolase [Clostridia bacterium]|nr:MBL fold metallo-hydrolase [Clostridia bacterium]